MKLSKTILAVVATGLLSCGLFSQQAQANQLTLNYGSRHSGNGGEFNASSPNFVPGTMGYKAATTFNGGIETFCLETNEFFNPGSTYYYGISQGAINGGASGGNPDRISRGTAFLYLKFAKGTLLGYDYSIGAAGDASAGALQATIWWLEGEGANPNNAFSTLVAGVPNYMADNNGFYGVGVLNLWGDSNHTQVAQDQLTLTVPDAGSTAMLLGVALGALGMARRFLKRQAV
jgi:hypothetical protein